MGPSRVPLQSVVTISDMHHLNLSDHTHLEIYISGIGAKDQLTGAKDFVPAINPQSRIRWGKCDLELYSDVVTEKLSTVSPLVECTLDAELLVRTISSTLREKGRPRKGSQYGMIESPQRYITVKWLILSGRRLVSPVTPAVIHTEDAGKHAKP